MGVVTILLSLLVAIGASWVAYNHQTTIPLVTAVLAIILFVVLLFSSYGIDRGRTL